MLFLENKKDKILLRIWVFMLALDFFLRMHGVNPDLFELVCAFFGKQKRQNSVKNLGFYACTGFLLGDIRSEFLLLRKNKFHLKIGTLKSWRME